jgi:hypothetical protein
VGWYFPLEEVGLSLQCKGKRVNGGPWEVDPSNVEPRKDDPKTVALTGVCEGGVDELERLGTPP